MGGAVSSGRDNNELVDNLIGGNYIRTWEVERVFRALDRADYMTGDRDQAYKDMAWRNGLLHLSAPCIYSEVMEGLELKPGLSFLNIGSGTGYLSTLVGMLIGCSGISHGVEIHSTVVEYANLKLTNFLDKSPSLDEFDFCEPKFFQGNGLCLAPLQSAYDRVYCGAGCPEEYQNYFKQLIKVGGVLVMPLNDNLVQVRRTSDNAWTSRNLLHVSFAPLRLPSRKETRQPIKLDEPCPPRLQVLSRAAVRAGVRRALLLRHPDLQAPRPRPPRNPRTAQSCPRRIYIPIDDDTDNEGLNNLHDLDPATGANEMNALLSLVLSMRQNRVAGALRFDPMAPPSGTDSSEESDGEGGENGGARGGDGEGVGGDADGVGGDADGGGRDGVSGNVDDGGGNAGGGGEDGDDGGGAEADAGGHHHRDSGENATASNIEDTDGAKAPPRDEGEGTSQPSQRARKSRSTERNKSVARFCRGILTLQYQNGDPEPGHSGDGDADEENANGNGRGRATGIARAIIRTTSCRRPQSDTRKTMIQILGPRPLSVSRSKLQCRTKSKVKANVRARPTNAQSKRKPQKQVAGGSKADESVAGHSKEATKEDSARSESPDMSDKQYNESETGIMDWEELEDKAASSDDEVKESKRQKLDSGIGEETPPSSGSSPGKPEKSEQSDPEAGPSSHIAKKQNVRRRAVRRTVMVSGLMPARRAARRRHLSPALPRAHHPPRPARCPRATRAPRAPRAPRTTRSPRTPRTPRAARRRNALRSRSPRTHNAMSVIRGQRLMLLMKRSMSELPLPHPLREYVNYGRGLHA